MDDNHNDGDANDDEDSDDDDGDDSDDDFVNDADLHLLHRHKATGQMRKQIILRNGEWILVCGDILQIKIHIKNARWYFLDNNSHGLLLQIAS